MEEAAHFLREINRVIFCGYSLQEIEILAGKGCVEQGGEIPTPVHTKRVIKSV